MTAQIEKFVVILNSDAGQGDLCVGKDDYSVYQEYRDSWHRTAKVIGRSGDKYYQGYLDAPGMDLRDRVEVSPPKVTPETQFAIADKSWGYTAPLEVSLLSIPQWCGNNKQQKIQQIAFDLFTGNLQELVKNQVQEVEALGVETRKEWYIDNEYSQHLLTPAFVRHNCTNYDEILDAHIHWLQDPAKLWRKRCNLAANILLDGKRVRSHQRARLESPCP